MKIFKLVGASTEPKNVLNSLIPIKFLLLYNSNHKNYLKTFFTFLHLCNGLHSAAFLWLPLGQYCSTQTTDALSLHFLWHLIKL